MHFHHHCYGKLQPDMFTRPESFEPTLHRTRAVIVCDICRSRKTKCVVQDGNSKCDACIRRKVECTHDERGRSHNEIEKVMASHISGGAGGLAATTSSLDSNFSIINLSPTPAAPKLDTKADSTSNSNDPSTLAALMPHFIELFFKQHAGTCPFMSYEATIAGYLQSTLSAVKSSSIACIASRYTSEVPEISSLDPWATSEHFVNQAKSLLSELSSSPSWDGVLSSILIAYHEHSFGRSDGLFYYAQLAARMAQASGLYDEAAIVAMGYSMDDHQRIVHLRHSVFQVYELALSGASEKIM